MSVHGIDFYTTGQFFLEEYYTLSIIGKGGLSTWMATLGYVPLP